MAYLKVGTIASASSRLSSCPARPQRWCIAQNETFRPKLDGPNVPFIPGQEPGTFVANEAYKDSPGAIFQLGNLSRLANASVHSGEDVVLTAIGPGSERVRGQIDNTEVFRIMAEALGLGSAETVAKSR
jgi:alkaline phosphatase